MARKKLSISRLRKKAWGVFSEYVRRKDADPDGMVECVTCGKKVFWKKIHAGHFRHGHVKATFLEEMNVHPQCVVCNMYKSGNLIEYYDYMRRNYTVDQLQWLEKLSHLVFKPTRDYYEGVINLHVANLSVLNQMQHD